MENYDVAMLAGHNVMHYNDSLKGDNVHVSFEPHSNVFQTVILIFLVLFEHDFLRNLRNLSGKETGTNMYKIFSCYYRVCFLSPEVSSDH